MFRKKIKIVTIGGGSGQYALLSGLRDLKNINIAAIVSMVDSGGSTGRLRDELGILPPGDALKCVLALSSNREVARKILLTRFECDNRLKGHNAGNMLLSMLAQYAGDFPAGINALGEILNIHQNRVLPVTTDRATLVAELVSGEKLYGESTIDIPIGSQRAKIKSSYLVPHHGDKIRLYPPVAEAVKEADYIIIGPGDMYTSIIPNFLVPGLTEEIKRSKAKIIYVMNIMTKYGETDDFKAKDFIRSIEKNIRKKINFVLINNGKLKNGLVKKYQKQKAEMVKIDKQTKANKKRIIIDSFINTKGDVVRHDSAKLALAIEKIIK